MTVKEEKIDILAPAETAAAPLAHAKTPVSAEEADKTLDVAAEGALKARMEHRKKSIGEKIYNRSVYTGIGFGANEVFSMIFTGMFERGKNRFLGRERFENVSQWMVNAFHFKDKVKNGVVTTAHENAKAALMWASLNFIGCFVVPAIKIVDKYKSGIIKRLNHRFGSSGLSDAEIAARDKEVEQAVACEPTQSWGTLWAGRIAGMITAIGLGGFVMKAEGNNKLKGWFNNGARVLTGKPKVNQDLLARVPSHKLSKSNYYTRLAGPETFGCATTSVVLEAASKFFAKHWPRFKDPKIRAEALAQEKEKLIAASTQYTAAHGDGDTAAPRGVKALAAARPAVSYAEKIASEPQTELRQGV